MAPKIVDSVLLLSYWSYLVSSLLDDGEYRSLKQYATPMCLTHSLPVHPFSNTLKALENRKVFWGKEMVHWERIVYYGKSLKMNS